MKQNKKHTENSLATELEQSVLGQILISPDSYIEIGNILKPEMFTISSYQMIFKAIQQLSDNNNAIDTLTVVDILRKQNVIDTIGGPAQVAKLTSKIVSSANIVYHAEIIKRNFFYRKLREIACNIISEIDNNSDVSQADIELKFDDLYKSTCNHKEIIPVQQQIISTILNISDNNNTKTYGITTGLKELDNITLGWQNGYLNVIGARPSVGKTALGLQFAITAAENKYNVLFFTMELTSNEIAKRIISNRTDISNTHIETKYNDFKKLIDPVCDEFFTKHLFIDDKSYQSIYSIRNKCRIFQKKHGLQLVVIDYLQLIAGDQSLLSNTNRYIGEISLKLKQMAKELNIPVILLSQLSRDVEKRNHPFPILSDLRDSGEIEQNADVIIFPTRYYRLSEQYWYDSNGNDLRNKALIDIAKNRNGEVKKFNICVNQIKSRWFDDTNDKPDNF